MQRPRKALPQCGLLGSDRRHLCFKSAQSLLDSADFVARFGSPEPSGQDVANHHAFGGFLASDLSLEVSDHLLGESVRPPLKCHGLPNLALVGLA